VSVLKLWDRLQFAGNLGFKIPFDSSAESTTSHLNAHFSYAVTDRFRPLVEMNYFRVLSAGDGGSCFGDQVGGAVPCVATFEGGDLINFGASNASSTDLVTIGAGFRYRLTDNIDLGAAYEIPLTEEEENLMESRITLDCSIHF
jgi:opacity protein-like surface antigen